MTPEELIKYLLESGFTKNGDDYEKDILVARRNEKEKRFEIFYRGKGGTEDTPPVYWYDQFLANSTPAAMKYLFTGLYDEIKNF